MGIDTFLINENKPFDTGMISYSQIITKGNVIDSVIQLIGYDKKADKYIMAELIKSSPFIEICNVWFTSSTAGEIVISNPKNSPTRFKFEFKTPDSLVQTALLDSKIVKVVKASRIK